MSAQSPEPRIEFSIPAGKASKTLTAAARIAAVNILFEEGNVRDCRTNAIDGTYTTREALQAMLAGTPCTVVPVNAGKSYAIIRRAAPAAIGEAFPGHSNRSTETLSPSHKMNLQKEKKKSLNTLLSGLLSLGIASSAPNAVAQNSDADENGIITLSPFTVTTEEDVAYTVERNISATRINVRTQNLPQSVVVFNQELLDDSNLVSLTNVMDLDPSLMNGFSREGGIGQIVARGMGGISLLFVDGFTTLGTNSIIPIAGVERLEILKGPNAVLYGETSPSGVINRVTKRARFDKAFGSIRATLADNNSNGILTRGIALDYSTPLDLKFVPEEWGEFAFRMEVQKEKRGTVKDTVPAEQLTVYPALSWRMSENTSLDLYGWYTEATADVQWEVPIHVENGGLDQNGKATGSLRYGFFLPDNSFFEFDDPRALRHTAPGKITGDDDARKTEDFVYMYDLQHRFNETVSFRSQGKYEDFLIDRMETLPLAGSDEWPVNRHPDTGDYVIGYTNPETGEFELGGRPGRVFGVERFGVPVTAEDWLIPRRPRFRNEDQSRFDWRNEVLIQARTGAFNHNLLVGHTIERFDAYRTRLEVRNPGQFPNPEDVANYPESGKWEFVSVRDPVGGGPVNFPRSSFHFEQTGGVTVPRIDFQELNRHSGDREVKGYYFNNLISGLEERLFINLGLRYQENTNNLNGRSADGDPLSAGVLYHLTEKQNISLYANGNETFQPVFAISDDGYDLPAITGEQFEVGLKFDLGANVGKKEGFLSGSFTYYDIGLKNIPLNIAENPEIDTILRPVGEGRESQGLEFTFTSAPVDGLRLFGGVAYILDVFDPALESTTARSLGLGPEDIWPQNISRWTANLLARYQFLDGGLKGTFFTLGVRHNDDRNSELLTGGGINRNINTFYRVPAETVVNFGVGKQFPGERSRWTVSLFVDNLTDELSLGRMMPWKVSFDPGRTFRLQVRNDF